MVYFTDDLDCYSTSELTERLAHFTLTSAMSDGEEQMPVTDMEFMEVIMLVDALLACFWAGYRPQMLFVT